MSVTVELSPDIVEEAVVVPKKKIKRKVRPHHINSDNCLFVIDNEYCYVLQKDGDIANPIGIIKESELIEELTKFVPIKTGLIAQNTIYHEKCLIDNQETYIIVLEFDPHKRMVHIGTNTVVDYTVALPFTQMFLQISKVLDKLVLKNSFISCTNKAIQSEKDQLYRLPISNVDYDLHICWGLDIDLPEDNNIKTYSRRLYNLFFGTLFNGDYGWHWPHDTYHGFPQWQEVSALEDGLLRCANTQYIKASGYTFEKMLRIMRGE